MKLFTLDDVFKNLVALASAQFTLSGTGASSCPIVALCERAQ